MTAVLAAAFAAGMVSTVNPCGFAMLPAYLGYFLANRSTGSVNSVAGVAVAVSSGFLVVFAAAGLLIAWGVRAVVAVIPWLALTVGAGLVVAGLAQLTGRRLLPYLRGPGRIRKAASFRGMFGFGVSYAVASLSCTLPIFLSLVGGAIASRTASQTILTFLAYGSGTALVVTAVTALVAGGRQAVVDRIRPLARHLDVVAGWTMSLAGLFIIWYWATVLSAGAATLGSNRSVRWIDQASAWLTGLLSQNPSLTAAAMVTALLVAYGWARYRHRPTKGPRHESSSA